MKTPEWNVYYYDFNSRTIKVRNILKSQNVIKAIIDATKKHSEKEDFGEEIRKTLMYHFWARAEYEVLIRGWCSAKDEQEMKIDIYEQIKINWDAFLDYVWNSRKIFEQIREQIEQG